MSIMKSIRRQMIGGYNDNGVKNPKHQATQLAGLFVLDEYLKHRTHRRDMGLEPIPRKRRQRGRKRSTDSGQPA